MSSQINIIVWMIGILIIWSIWQMINRFEFDRKLMIIDKKLNNINERISEVEKYVKSN